jgi:hypothetical protein
VDEVVSLMSNDEVREFGFDDERRILESEGIRFKQFAVPDKGTPPMNAETLGFLKSLLKQIHAGKNVVIHCHKDQGRSAFLASSLLVMDGEEPNQAIKRCGWARLVPVPDTRPQVQWVRTLALRVHPFAKQKNVKADTRAVTKRVGVAGAVALLGFAAWHFWGKRR